MFRRIKKILFLSLVLIYAIFSTNFAFVSFEDTLFNHIDFLTTYANFKQEPTYALNGELIVVGDSYAFLLATNCEYGLDYIVHQGYTVKQINELLIDEIPVNRFKYAFVFIGPNDFVRQTNLFDFKIQLQMIINKLRYIKTEPLFVTYLTPCYDRMPELATKIVGCTEYANILRELVKENNLLYFDIVDLFTLHGWIDDDFIHPNYTMYKPLMDRVVNYLREDMNKKESISTNYMNKYIK